MKTSFKVTPQVLFVVVFVAINIFIFTLHFLSDDSEPRGISNTLVIVSENDEKIDWHDYEFMEYEASRVGPGEQGKPYKLTNEQEILEDKKSFNEDGFSRIISDQISCNRSLPDIRLDV